MNFSQKSLRGAEICHIWKHHHRVECFWKIMKSIFQMRSMQLQGDGLDTALLIKVFAYLLARRLTSRGVFSKLTITEIMRKWRREEDLREFLGVHLTHCGMQDEDQLRQDLSMMFLTEISTRTLSIMSTRLMGRRVSPTAVSNATKELISAVEQWRQRD